MVFKSEVHPFFSQFISDLNNVNENFEKEKERLIKEKPIFYKLKMFRAFNLITEREESEMTPDLYLDLTIVLQEVLLLWHAPFLTK